MSDSGNEGAKSLPVKGLAEATATKSRIGIKAKLFLALCTLAAFTAIASAVSWYLFVDIGRSVTRVTAESLPSMVTALSLAEKSREIAVTAPALMASGTQEERVLEEARLTQRTEALNALISELSGQGVTPEVTRPLFDLRSELTAKLEDLDVAIRERLRLKSGRETRLAELGNTHNLFLDSIEPLVDDSVFDLVITGERVTARSTQATTRLVEGGVSRLDSLLTLNAEANLAAGLLSEVTHVSDAALIQPIHERFEAASAAMERSLSQLPKELADRTLREAVTTLLAIGKGEESVFRHRLRELKGLGEQGNPGDGNTRSALLKEAHERLLLLLTSLIDDEAFDLVLTTESETKQSRDAITNLIDGGAHLLHVLLTVRAEVNLAAGLLNQAASETDVRRLQPLRERFSAAVGQIQRMMVQLPRTLESVEVRKATTSLLDMGRADDGLFAMRHEELQQMARARAALEESRTLTDRLGVQVAELVDTARDESQATAISSEEAISGGKLFMLILSACSILGAGAVMFYYVGPRLIHPIESVTQAMTDLAGGDTSVEIPGRERGDELGRMAQALGVFRDTAIEVQESNLREIRETRRRLSDAIESISEAFSLYDRDDRLVICNEKYRSLLYPGMADAIEPGVAFETVVRRSIAEGLILDAEEDPEAWLAQRMDRHQQPTEPHIQQRSDGLWVLASERKTEDGEGVRSFV